MRREDKAAESEEARVEKWMRRAFLPLRLKTRQELLHRFVKLPEGFSASVPW